MADHAITFARSARKELSHLPESLTNRVLSRIEMLATNPRPSGTRKLTGTQNLWRIRIGDYRVLYTIDDANRAVDIIAVRHRSDAYR